MASGDPLGGPAGVAGSPDGGASRDPGGADEPGGASALFRLLDQVADSVLVAAPVTDAAGIVADFSIVHLSPGYVDPAGRPARVGGGRTLLLAFPGSAADDGLFARAARVLARGVPEQVPGPVGPLSGGSDADISRGSNRPACGVPGPHPPWPYPQGQARSKSDDIEPVGIADLHAARYGGQVVFTWRARAVDDGQLAELEHVRTRVALAATRDLLADSEQRAAEEHELALRLQRAIMPSDVRLVETAGVDIAVRCRPAKAGSLMAGDWYDALQLPDGDLLFVVGDIAGHGIEAVTGMVAARNALRGLVVTGGDPRDLLGKLNYAACLFSEGVTGTVICARYDPRTRLLSWARAGHLPPVLVRDDIAEIQPMPEGMLLGMELNAQYEQAVLQLRPGDTLLFYTDGLIERRADSISDALADFAKAAAPADPDVDSHVARILGTADSDTGDDACLLAVRIR
jgi:serine phosphatase RsbU (regulator of sigma subunit)